MPASSLKTVEEVEAMRYALAESQPTFEPDYLQGIEDALRWVIGDLTDHELLTGEEND